jgi:hypothetical protein
MQKWNPRVSDYLRKEYLVWIIEPTGGSSFLVLRISRSSIMKTEAMRLSELSITWQMNA